MTGLHFLLFCHGKETQRDLKTRKVVVGWLVFICFSEDDFAFLLQCWRMQLCFSETNHLNNTWCQSTWCCEFSYPFFDNNQIKLSFFKKILGRKADLQKILGISVLEEMLFVLSFTENKQLPKIQLQKKKKEELQYSSCWWEVLCLDSFIKESCYKCILKHLSLRKLCSFLVCGKTFSSKVTLTST